MTEEKQIWDRREGESSRWFSRFETYRLMGPERTQLGAVNIWKDKNGKRRAKAPARAWQLAFKEFDWKKRAEAWDDSERARQAKLREGEADRLFENVEQALKALYAKYTQRLQDLDSDEIEAKVLTPHFLSLIKKLEQTYGRDVIQKVELTGKDGAPIKFDLDTERIISKRAEEIRQQLDDRTDKPAV